MRVTPVFREYGLFERDFVTYGEMFFCGIKVQTQYGLSVYGASLRYKTHRLLQKFSTL